MTDRAQLVSVVLRVIQQTANRQGQVTMIHLAENIATALVRMEREGPA